MLPVYRLIAVVLAYAVWTTRACPQPIADMCKCQSTNDGLKIDCFDQPLDDIVRALSSTTMKVIRLGIRDTTIRKLPADAFAIIRQPIQELDMSGVHLEQIDDEAFSGQGSNINSLILANNSLQSFPSLTTLNNLEALDLGYNNLTGIPENTFTGIGSLRILRVPGNKICALAPNSLNETKSQLETLDLSGNCFVEVPAQNFRGAQNLKYLDLSANRLEAVKNLQFMNLPVLTELRLNGNQITQFHPLAFMNVPNLERLVLRDNQLTSMETDRLQQFSKLEVLDLSNNRLIKIPTNAFKDVISLKQLLLDNNRIETIETLAFSSLAVMQLISLQNNGLKTVFKNAFDSMPVLNNLLLSNNSLSDLGQGQLAGMPSLKTLTLDNNKLTKLSAGAFDAVQQLTTLDLAGNQLRSVDPQVFPVLGKLFWLDLSRNQLTGLPKDSFQSKISNLLLEGNPLLCDDSINWLIKYIVDNNVRTFLPGQTDVKCAQPPEKRGVLLKDLLIQQANQTYHNNLDNGQDGFRSGGINNTIAAQIASGLLSAFVTPAGGANSLALLSTPLSKLIANGGAASSEDVKSFLDAMPQLALLLSAPNGLDQIDLTKMPPQLINYVTNGGVIPGISKDMMTQLTQRYIQQMAAKAVGLPSQPAAGQQLPGQVANNGQQAPAFKSFSELTPADINNLVTGAMPLPPLTELPPDLVQNVIGGGTLPGFTAEQTEAIKNRYMNMLQGVNTNPAVPSANTNNSSGTSGNPGNQSVTASTNGMKSLLNLDDLKDLNINISKIPADVLQDLAAGRVPDLSKIPQDLIQTIMNKKPLLFSELVNRQLQSKMQQPGGSILDRMPPTQVPLDRVATGGKPYDVGALDTKSDISVYNQEKQSQQAAVWTAAGLGCIGALTILVIVILCCRRRQHRRAEKQNEETSDTSKFFGAVGHNLPTGVIPPDGKLKNSLNWSDTTSRPVHSNRSAAMIGREMLDAQRGTVRGYNNSASVEIHSPIVNHQLQRHSSLIESPNYYAAPTIAARTPPQPINYDGTTRGWMFVENPNEYRRTEM